MSVCVLVHTLLRVQNNPSASSGAEGGNAQEMPPAPLRRGGGSGSHGIHAAVQEEKDILE